MATIPREIQDLYNRYFGNRPVVTNPEITYPASDAVVPTNNPDTSYPVRSAKGAILKEKFLDVEVWLPITLSSLPSSIHNDKSGADGEWYLPYCTVSISGSASVIKTPLTQRKGSAKELYSIDDYVITVRGFMIDKAQRSLPEREIGYLKSLFESGGSFKIDNAITNIFLEDITLPPDQQYRVIIERFQMPEVTGGRMSARPFSFDCLSDYIFTLTET